LRSMSKPITVVSRSGTVQAAMQAVSGGQYQD
jgi:hypothetical protein